jgi:hypothetical protein
MSASVIVSTGTIADAPGYGQQSHGFVDSTGKLWDFQYRSASATTLYARYSSDKGATWNDPTNNTFTLTYGNDGSGRELGVFYKRIASTDVVHVGYFSQSISIVRHLRATLSGTTVSWGAELDVDSGGGAANAASPVTVASDGTVWANDNSYDGASAAMLAPSPNGTLDTTAAWTGANWTTLDRIESEGTTANGVAFLPLSSGGKVLALSSNGSSATPNNVRWSLYSGSSWGAAADVFGSTVNINPNDWGCCLRTDTDAHFVRYEGSGVFTHRRWNGTSMAAGQSIPSQTSKVGAGCALTTDKTSVWLFIIDTDAANTVRYCKWNGTSWGSWTALETSTQVRKYITAYYDAVNSQVNVSWGQTNGSNYDLTFEALVPGGGGTITPPPPIIVRQAVQRAATR